MPYITTMQGEKNTYQVEFNCKNLPFLDMNYSGIGLKGYEIHMGETVLTGSAQGLFHIVRRSNETVDVQDGFINDEHHVFGTYCHGIFDNDDLRRSIINALRKRKGLEPFDVQFKYRQYKESEFDRLASTVRKHFDMKKFYEILERQ